MKKLLILVCLIYAVGAIAQSSNPTATNLKKITGIYEFAPPYGFAVGDAVYYTRENKDYEIVREGPFTYTCSMNNSTQLKYSLYDSFSMKISGNYKNGFKNGEWNSTVVTTVPEYLNTTVTKVNYKDGLPHGNWVLKHTNKNKQTIQEIRCKFKNGVMVGKFYYADFNYQKKYEGDLDSNGFLNGRFSVTAGKREYIFECQHGILLLFIVRDAGSGEIFQRTVLTDSTSRALLEPFTRFEFDKKKSNFENLELFTTTNSDKLNVGSIDLNDFPVQNYGSTFNINVDFSDAFNYGLAFKAIGGDRLFRNEGSFASMKKPYDWKSFVIFYLKK